MPIGPFTFDQLPPEMQEQLQQQQQHQEAMGRKEIELGREIWDNMKRFAPLICCCRRQYEWGNPSGPPQGNCQIHGIFDNHMIDIIRRTEQEESFAKPNREQEKS